MQVVTLCSSLRYLFGVQTGPKAGVECLKASGRLVWRICEKLGSNLSPGEAPVLRAQESVCGGMSHSCPYPSWIRG